MESRTYVLFQKHNFIGEQKLWFDGKQLCWIDSTGRYNRCWSAVSGRPGYQSKQYQSVKDYGPLPEGKWIVKQSEYQTISPRNAALGLIRRGEWVGSVFAWGRHRIWLHPIGSTKTFGRVNFSIHGGIEPGSAGCIDMTKHIDEFVVRFLEYRKDMELTVEY